MKAYENIDFIHSPDARILRVLSEFIEPERRLRRSKIKDTIVFFGSARALSAEAAQANLDKVKNGGTAEEIAKAEQAVKLSRYYVDAVALSAKMTEWSMNLPEQSRRFIICSGGGPGIMEAANRGAQEVDGMSIGFNISLHGKEPPNDYISENLDFLFHYFFVRKYWFVYLAKALIIFPGGFGTLDELMEVLTLLQTRKVKKKIPIVVYGSEYWNDVINLEGLVKWGTIHADDLNLVRYCDTVDDAFEYLTGELQRLYIDKS